MRNKSSQLNPTPYGVLGTMAKLLRLTGVEWSHWLYPTNNVEARRNLADFLEKGCPKITNNGEIVTPTLPEGEELCRLILRDDYLSPQDVAKAYGWRYSDDQLANFAETLPDTETLLWLHYNDYMLVATPPNDTNLLQVRNLDSQLFYSKSESWYSESQYTFYREDVVEAGQWLMVRKELYPDSRRKNWDEQRSLLSKVENVPNAPEISYAVTAYYKVRGVNLLKSVYVRTSSVAVDGDRVLVGYFGGNGLHVDDCWDGNRDDRIGVSSARK